MSSDSNDSAPVEHKKKRTRSPNYPSLTLEEAIKKIGLIHDSEDRHWASPDAIAAHWNMSATGGSFLTSLGAIKQFGLVDDQGQGATRKIRIAEIGLDLVLRTPDTPEWREAAKTAALTPKLHAELWSKYGGSLPPKDDSIRIYLIRERPAGVFNRSHVDSFISQFRSTIAYAGLTSSDIIGADRGDEDDDLDMGENMGITTLEPKQATSNSTGNSQQKVSPEVIRYAPISSEAWDGPTVKFDMPRGNLVEVRLRHKLTKAEFEKLKRIFFDISELAIVEDELDTDEL